MIDQIATAKYLQARIDWTSNGIRENRENVARCLKAVDVRQLSREIQYFIGNQMVLKELLTIAVELLDPETFYASIHCEADVQEPLKP